MQLFVVGGAVRDRLLGQPAQDRDWVAVGATPEQLVAQGYRPVGRDFPVFLHPVTGEEVALARTERKSAPGYRGFVVHASPEVTLEQDLARRDLTINAMAETAEGALIDPFGGARDLTAGVLRHVSPAFVEDPVRLLRVARFAARWPHFTLAPETAALLAQMVAQGEVDALVPERVWQELARGLMTERPSRMFQVLADCGALQRLLPELQRPAAAGWALDLAAREAASLPERFALLGWSGPDAAEAAGLRLRAPNECQALARLFLREQEAACRPAPPAAAEPEAVLTLLERSDALRRPDRFQAFLRCCGWAARSAGAAVPVAVQRLRVALQAAHEVDSAAASAAALARGARGPAVGSAVRAARLQAVQQALAAAG